MTRPADRPSRREALVLGGLAPLGIGLPALFAAETRASKPRAKSCLLFLLEGGPSHIDLWDMKPDAPAEVRGNFKPVATRVPGLHVCEYLPRLSGLMHHLALVRSVHHTITDHNAGNYYAVTGHPPFDGSKLVVSDGPTNFPPFGAVLANTRPSGTALPDFVHIPEVMSNLGYDIPGQSAGFLGAACDPFVTGDVSLPGYKLPGLSPAPEVPAERLDGRDRLRQRLDRSLARLADSPALGRADTLRRRAMELVGSAEVRRAFDLSREPLAVRERYGVYPDAPRHLEARQFGGLPALGQSALLARRLIEAGVRLVTLCSGRSLDQTWDTHRNSYPLMKQSLLPPFDRACSALLEDLSLRGLLDETLVVLMGEFGRTPKIGYKTSPAGATSDGRDHWPYCYTVMFAGAGVPGGLIHGASDRIGAYPRSDPVTPEDIAATIYAILGVPEDAEVRDAQNRPYPLLRGTAIRPLLR